MLAGRRAGQAQTQTGYDAQVAEVLVYNRDLPSADRRKLTAYLRSKYQLDVLDALFPAGAMLLQAEDFDGPWKIAAGLDPLGPTSLGHGPVVSPEVGEQGAGSREQGARSFLPGTLQVAPRSPLPATGQGMEGMRRTVLIPRPGDYSVWVRAANLESGGGIKTVVGGKALALTHTDAAMSLSWQLAGRTDLPAGETEIVIASEGPGRKEFDAVLISPTASTVADVEEICALARRLHQAPSPGQIAAVFADGRRIEGNLVSGFKGSGVGIARSQPGETSRPAAPGEPEGGDRSSGTFPPMGTAVRLLLLPGVADKGPISPDEAPSADTLFEFHNGDRIRGSICGYAAATTVSGESVGAQLLVEPSQDLGKAAKKPISVQIDWLRRIVFDSSPSTASGAPPRRCPPRLARLSRRASDRLPRLRFSGEGVSLITDQGLTRIGFRELAEAVLPPMDVWEAYYRQLAVVDPACDLGLVRLETRHGMVFTASSTGVRSFRAETEAAASTCLIQPAWSRTAIPIAWSAVCREWRAPACLVPLSQIAPQSAVQGGALDGGWRWQADHNVAGGELKSGGLQYFWGFGVHAPSELVFPLPDSAQAFRSGFGLDSSVGDFGSVVAKISIGDSAAPPLFQSKPLAGSRSAISTGDLVLGHHVPMVGDKPGGEICC